MKSRKSFLGELCSPNRVNLYFILLPSPSSRPLPLSFLPSFPIESADEVHFSISWISLCKIIILLSPGLKCRSTRKTARRSSEIRLVSIFSSRLLQFWFLYFFTLILLTSMLIILIFILFLWSDFFKDLTLLEHVRLHLFPLCNFYNFLFNFLPTCGSLRYSPSSFVINKIHRGLIVEDLWSLIFNAIFSTRLSFVLRKWKTLGAQSMSSGHSPMYW